MPVPNIPSSSGHHTRVRSNAEIPAEEFRTLYEFELRLTEKLDRLRSQTKEDMATAIALMQAPIMGRFDRIDSRLSSGEDKFEAHERRLGEHSDMIEKNSLLYKERQRGMTTNIQKAVSDKSAGGWISVEKIPSILTAAGILISGIIGSIALLRNPQQIPATIQTPQVIKAPSP